MAQEVLAAVARAVQLREHDRQRAKFRTWLHRVAHNAILNALTRGRPDRARAIRDFWNCCTSARQGHAWVIGGEAADHKGTLEVLDAEARNADASQAPKD